MKQCTNCRTFLPFTSFYKDKKSRDGYKWECVTCNKKKSKDWYFKNKEKAAITNKKWMQDNTTKRAEYQSNYEHSRRDCRSQQIAHNWQKNKEKHYIKRKQRLENPLFREAERIRSATSNAYKGVAYGPKTQERLGCSLQEFVNYIESKLKSDMTRDNYGMVWCFDHIIPLVKAESIEELQKLSKYTNIQPTYIKDNLRKQNKTEEEYITYKAKWGL